MKVVIGPYPSRWTSYIFDRWIEYRYKVDHYWNINEDQYDKLDLTIEWIEDRLQSIYNMTINKYYDSKKRKIKVHIDHYDIWSADHTMALIIHPLMIRLKNKKHGAAWVDDSDVPEELKTTSAPPKKEEWDTDDNWAYRYDWVLDEIIWTFEQLADPDNGDNFTQFEEDPTGQFGLRIVKNDAEKRKIHNDRIDNGLRLYAKYYRTMWD